jgi:hypothetical protein
MLAVETCSILLSCCSVLLQCTDLDGTLIEDGEEGDWVRQNDELTYLCAQHFAQYLAPAGGLIVFNTGRSIGEAGDGVAAVAHNALGSPVMCMVLVTHGC